MMHPHIFAVPDVEWIGYEDKCFEVKKFFSVADTTNAEACKLTCQISSKCVMVEYQPGVKKKCRMAEHRKFQHIRSCDHGSRKTDLFVKGKYFFSTLAIVVVHFNLFDLCLSHY